MRAALAAGERPAMRVLVLAGIAWWLALALTLSGRSAAAEPPRFVIVTAPDLTAFGARLRAELTSMGFHVDLGAAEPLQAPGESAQLTAARAQILISRPSAATSEQGVELSVMDRAAGATVLQSILYPTPGNDPSALPLRSAELLRGTLSELDAEHSAGPSGARASPPGTQTAAASQTPQPVPLAVAPAAGARDDNGDLDAALARDAARGATLHLAAVAVASAGGLALFPSAEIGAEVWLAEKFGIELSALVPLASMSQRAAEGSTKSRASALLLALRWTPLFVSGRWIADLGADVAGIRFSTRGTPASGAYAARENSTLAVAPLLSARVAFAISRRFRLVAQLRAGAALPRVRLEYAGRSAARWGAPLLLGGFGMEVDVP
jgi:hypothetical protein